MKRARIIYNPTSGREVFKKHLPEVLEKLEVAGYETSCHATTCEGDATLAAKNAVERGFDIIIAVGGDGTLNEVVSGVSPFENRPKVGLIPMGTTNDFARAVHIPRNIDEAVDIIIQGDTLPVDVGLLNGERYFINIAAGGRITELTYEVPSKMKTMLGQLAYYVKAVEMIPSIKASHMRIEYDGEVFDGDAMMFLCGLTNSVGGFEKLAPDASINDGYFTVIVLKKVSLPEFIQLAAMALRGEHLNDDRVIYKKASVVKVTTENEVHLNLDGEYGGDAPATFENLKRHIEIFVPLADIREEDRI
ncbi:MAG TPA: diacylglycerol kinase [Lysinibacillus sp.]|uniref:Diacylglycerol kinase n=1 Tax=Lysinibacillus fusiformis TaxID=28031 RepID=A0A2I0UWD5_9BACI|nr:MULTISPECIES: diacylglycerol kinase [Lysinibacillus]HBT72183.1 diacylglycerol kinase [Lysinibacillus sp.]MEE3809324.1 diacylglycerol kinase [Lysinibacillus fusiformis]PKU50345.1 diacylglycerol kinase [Lysinibacillus fusiformis]WCH47283.1 diacylglycerol kinase [Lysinibacillus sp. OF-1]SCZ05143.1 diacylglycerol kinase [Lysinibacillus sp. SG9]